MKSFTFVFDEKQLMVIMQALAEVRYRVSAPVIEYIASQVTEQQSNDVNKE